MLEGKIGIEGYIINNGEKYWKSNWGDLKKKFYENYSVLFSIINYKNTNAKVKPNS